MKVKFLAAPLIVAALMAGIYSSAPHKSDHDDDPGP
jgi:hypothetical protein